MDRVSSSGGWGGEGKLPHQNILLFPQEEENKKNKKGKEREKEVVGEGERVIFYAVV